MSADQSPDFVRLRVLVACEFSGTVRDAFIRAGHDAMSCDILPSESDFGPHHQGDVLDILDAGWDLMIAHPPCTFLTNSGVRWLYSEELRWQKMIEGAVFFRAMLNAPIPRIAVENPIMHGFAASIVGHKPDQVVQPWMFGHLESKGHRPVAQEPAAVDRDEQRPRADARPPQDGVREGPSRRARRRPVEAPQRVLPRRSGRDGRPVGQSARRSGGGVMDECIECGSTDLDALESDLDCYACDLMECGDCGAQFGRDEIVGVMHSDECKRYLRDEQERSP